MSLLLEGRYYCPHFRERETGVPTGEEAASERIPELVLPKLHETNPVEEVGTWEVKQGRGEFWAEMNCDCI